MAHARLLSLATTMALMAAILTAGAASAASPQVTVISDKCSLAGGAWNEGFIALRVRAAERDLAGVTVIRFTALLMHQPRAGGSWAVHQTQVRALLSGSGRTWTGAWNFGGDVAGFRHRVDMTVDFMTSNGAIVATRGVSGGTC